MVTAISLFSGGLDSILASRVVAAQGIKVVAVKFISPFFEYGLLTREVEYVQEVKAKYGIDLLLKDISLAYIELLKDPAHGYGKHFNPCIDCKIFMISKAKEMMAEHEASFLITGEVIGQRPMSQRRDALRIIERDSGCDIRVKRSREEAKENGNSGSILLRPLCAKNLKPTKPELDGLVDREQLLGFSGRGRTDQMNLAKDFGITDYPAPAGGCILTDPIVSQRIKEIYRAKQDITVADMRFAMVGRQFRLPGGGWLVMGRKEVENSRVEEMLEPGDIYLKLVDRPGPTAILRYMSDHADLELATGLVARYGKKDENGLATPGQVLVRCGGEEHLEGTPPHEELVRKLLW